MIAHYYHEIDGWFDFRDIYADAVAKAVDGDTLVEIGCWKGKSLSFLLVEAANSGKRLTVVGVDPFTGLEGAETGTPKMEDVRAECVRNCDRSGYPYRLVEHPSPGATAEFSDGSLEFVFLDGCHLFDAVRADVRGWLPKIKPGGVIAGHDYRTPHGIPNPWPHVEFAVREHFAPGDVEISRSSWKYTNRPPIHGEWVRPVAGTPPFLVYVPYVNRHDIFQNCLRSVAGHASRVVVVDQSAAGPTDFHPGPLYRWTTPRRFTAVMNWVRADAIARGIPYYFFLHSDAEAAPDGIAAMVAEADRLTAAGERWGVIFSHYDALCLVNTVAARDVGCWDETFAWYVADADWYNRFRWDGWAFHHLPAACHLHHTSQTKHALTAEEVRAVESDQEWAIAHYRHKWGCHWEDGPGRTHAVPYNGRP